jgi:hypothetical protein
MGALEQKIDLGLERLRSVPAGVSLSLASGSLLLAAGILVLLLVAPGKTYEALHNQDLMIFFDAAHRLLEGQVPNRDFHTPLGPLAYVLLAGGYWITGSLGGTMPMVTGLFVLLLAPPLIYACVSRLPLPVAFIFGVHILLLAVAPVFTGRIDLRPTFAMFYNRFGWVLLSILFLFAIPRKRLLGSSGDVADAIVMSAMLLGLLYLKVSYAVVATVFLLILLVLRQARKAALGAGLLSLALILVIELFWLATQTYFQDIVAAGAARGALQGGVAGLINTALTNIMGLYLFAAVAVIGLFRSIQFKYWVAILFMAGSGLLIANQNYQGPGILTLVPAGLLALLAPAPAEDGKEFNLTILAGFLLLGGLIVPPAVSGFAVLAQHFAVAKRVPDDRFLSAELNGLMAIDDNLPKGILPPGYPCGKVDPTLLNLDRRGREPGDQAAYLMTLRDGAVLLRNRPDLAGTALIFDFANPFNLLVNRKPPAGGNQWYHLGTNFSQDLHPPAREVFATVEVVMIPKFVTDYPTFDGLRQIYGPYLHSHYQLTARSKCWDAYRRKPTLLDKGGNGAP